MRNSELLVRKAMETDLASIDDIYNHYVLNSTCTYQEKPGSLAARTRWFRHHDNLHPVIVAVLDGLVIGWGSLSAFHARSAYRHTVENSIYVHHQWQRHGAGALLLQQLIGYAQRLGHHAIIAGIDASQLGSIALHAKYGFEHVGRFNQVGYKFGRWLDVIYMELIITENQSAQSAHP